MKSVIIDPQRCIGCKHCVIACGVAHSNNKDIHQILYEDIPPVPRIFVDVVSDGTTFPNKCRHCDPSYCMQACPTGAIQKDEITSSITIDPNKCIRCFMCAMVCPFGVIRFFKDNKAPFKDLVAVKCDNCIDRLKEDKIPACAEACKTGALKFGEVNDILREKHLVVIEQKGIPENIKIWRTFKEKIKEVNAN